MRVLRAVFGAVGAAIVLGSIGVASVGASHVAPTVRDVDMANLSQNERELSIAVDPNDPDHLAAGANQRSGTQRWYTSTNGGRTWSNGALPNGTLTVPGTSSTLMSDPSLDFGSNGEIYYSALMHGGTGEPCTLFVSESANDGANWTDPANGVVFAGTTSPNVCNDKEMILVDRQNNDNVYVAWTPFDDPTFNREVVFSRDLNGVSDGLSFSAPVALSSGCFNHGADLAEDASGTLYVAWTQFCSGADDGAAASVLVVSSTTQGASWSSPVVAATLNNVAPTGIDPNFRSRTFPSIDVDPATGRVFVVYNSYATAPTTDANVYIVSSPDGVSWTSPTRVNQDSGTTEQVMPWLDAGNERLQVSYYSRADDGTNWNQHVAYGAVSATPSFTEITVSSAGTPASTGFLGDYVGIIVGSDDVVHAAWGDGRSGAGGATDAYTARVDFSPPTSFTVSPMSSSPTVGNLQALTAHVIGAHGENEHFIPVTFTVTSSGSPSPPSGSGATGSAGTFSFSYTNTVATTDTVHVFADLNENAVQDVGEVIDATVMWQPGLPATLTLSPATDTNTVDDTHQVTAEVEDQYGNHVLPVRVRFSVSGANGTLGIPTSGSAMTVGGFASFSYVGIMPGDDTITAFADTNDDGVRDPSPAAHEPQGTATKTWSLPATTTGRTTGTGTILGGTASFSFAAHGTNTGGPKGSFTFTAPGRAVVSLSITSVVVSGSTATFFGTATINGAGSFVFRVDVVDNAEPGVADTLRLRMSDGYDTGVAALTSGNLQTH